MENDYLKLNPVEKQRLKVKGLFIIDTDCRSRFTYMVLQKDIYNLIVIDGTSPRLHLRQPMLLLRQQTISLYIRVTTLCLNFIIATNMRGLR